MTGEELKKKANQLPMLPGVYLMKDREGSIIYVGKSKHLKMRVTSYFGKSRGKSRKVQRMVRQIEDFEHIVTDTELDALLLECELIKKIQPLYNRLLKNDRRFRYVHLNEKSEKPFWEIAYDRKEKGIFFGPYDMNYELQQGIDAINKYYGLTQNKARNDQDYTFTLIRKEVLSEGIDENLAACYAKRVEESKAFFKNQNEEIILAYKKKMESAAENLQFEVAKRYKEMWDILSRMTYHKKAIAWSTSNEKNIVYVMQPKGGTKVYFLIGATIIKTISIKQKRFLKKWNEYFDIELPERDHIEKWEIDRAYIIYSYLHRSELCECIRID